MKLNPFRHHPARPRVSGAKPVPVSTPPPRARADTPPRVWSLLLPPAFTNDRR
jgi:hypothetical protein